MHPSFEATNKPQERKEKDEEEALLRFVAIVTSLFRSGRLCTGEKRVEQQYSLILHGKERDSHCIVSVATSGRRLISICELENRFRLFSAANGFLRFRKLKLKRGANLPLRLAHILYKLEVCICMSFMYVCMHASKQCLGFKVRTYIHTYILRRYVLPPRLCRHAITCLRASAPDNTHVKCANRARSNSPSVLRLSPSSVRLHMCCP